MITAPTMQSAHPILPCRFNFSLRMKEDRTALLIEEGVEEEGKNSGQGSNPKKRRIRERDKISRG